ncbi:hypothetical protein BKA70DRAFT_1227869 [Coprinopsis sp. MPI-PUGE-AT-0042]|nr:hypothetical protein BKA70DRAFT_1227869 [Coprinopsis sp. MPI-PUGE-AT-0042]
MFRLEMARETVSDDERRGLNFKLNMHPQITVDHYRDDRRNDLRKRAGLNDKIEALKSVRPGDRKQRRNDLRTKAELNDKIEPLKSVRPGDREVQDVNLQEEENEWGATLLTEVLLSLFQMCYRKPSSSSACSLLLRLDPVKNGRIIPLSITSVASGGVVQRDVEALLSLGAGEQVANKVRWPVDLNVEIESTLRTASLAKEPQTGCRRESKVLKLIESKVGLSVVEEKKRWSLPSLIQRPEELLHGLLCLLKVLVWNVEGRSPGASAWALSSRILRNIHAKTRLESHKSKARHIARANVTCSSVGLGP